ncbi:hypothetical protein EBBID32_26160 [Sphingobium indicum BiD32]|uniref:Uncharacterized protein n=1 Tax=Sphingobium indicum BiD32 TaxID=1301087 RepID=N1MM47_9SPHN|nr:hypothetical protein EBBID32_26160 [Sphingobium indicum BiD32]
MVEGSAKKRDLLGSVRRLRCVLAAIVLDANADAGDLASRAAAVS